MTKSHRIPIDENLKRLKTRETPLLEGASSFILDQKHKSYKQQFSNIYFARLHFLRGFVEERAATRWQDLQSKPHLMDRVLEVQKGKLCYIIGTVYIDMPMKPNILEDIVRDRAVPVPPRRDKIYSPDDATYLEDESGRIRIVGKPVEEATLVTGIIVSVLGMENDSGEFDVIDLCYCGPPPQPTLSIPNVNKMDLDENDLPGEWVALVSGLNVGAMKPEMPKQDIRLQLLVEYLTSELGSSTEQFDSSQITRLVIAGDSFTPVELRDEMESLINPRADKDRPHIIINGTPSNEILGGYLLDIGRSMPIHIMPGQRDPSAITLPQQPLPRAMFGPVKALKSFKCETNPIWLSFEGCHILGTSGQPLKDMCSYLPDTVEGNGISTSKDSLRIRLMKTSLHSRHLAPTAPDTLHCFPYLDADPFILNFTPHLLFHGNQPQFETALFEENNVKCRFVCIPKFAEDGQFVLFNTRTLAVKLISLDAEGME